MKNYIIKQATIYKRVAKTATGEQVNYWANCQLTSADPNDPIPNEPPVMAIINDVECQKFWKCSKALPAGDARLNRYRNTKDGVTITAQELVFAEAMKAFKDQKFADGTPCEKKTLVFNQETMDFEDKTLKDPFFYKANVNAREKQPMPPGTWVEIATTDRTIALADGTTKLIKAGQPIIGKNDEPRIVTSFAMAVQYTMEDGQWVPVDDVEKMRQRFIELHFRRIDQPIANTPGAPTGSTADADVNAEEAAKQAEAEKAAAELGGVPF